MSIWRYNVYSNELKTYVGVTPELIAELRHLAAEEPERGATQAKIDSYNLLFTAIFLEDIDKIAELANESVVNTLNTDGDAPLHLAAIGGHAQSITALINAGAKVDLPNKVGATALWLTVHEGHVGAVTALLAAKASLMPERPSNTSRVIYEARKKVEEENTPVRREIATLLEQHLSTMADEGNVEAQLMLASDYLLKNTLESQVEARKWFNQAFEKGHLDGQYMVGKMMLEGKGGPQNHKEARRLLLDAAGKGHEAAKCVMNRVTKNRKATEVVEMVEQHIGLLEKNKLTTQPKSKPKHETKDVVEHLTETKKEKNRQKQRLHNPKH